MATRRKVSDNRYREWSEIHNDYKLVDENGTRLVLYNDGGRGTVLGPWIGPDGNRSARRNKRASRKRAKEVLYFAALNSSGEMVEITAKPYGDGYIWSYQGPDYNDYDQALISLPIEESYSLFLEDMGLTKGDYPGPEMYTANRMSNRRRTYYARHRANRRYATSNEPTLLSAEFFGMGWTNGHTGLVGHFVMYDKWLGAMVRAGDINGPKELEREFMASRARELENMSDIDWSQVDWNDVYNFLNGK